MAQSHGVYYEKTPPTAVAAKLAGFPKHASELATIEELKPWHCVALARHVVFGQPYVTVGKEMKHSPDAISAVAKSPAGQAFIAKMESQLKNPVKLVKDMMASDAFGKWVDWQQAWEWAMQEKDYEAIHKMAKDIGLQPALEQEGKAAGPTKISLHLNMGDLAAPASNSRFQVMEAEIVEEDATDE